METRIAIVGFGQRGKDIVNQCLKYSKETQIVQDEECRPRLSMLLHLIL